MTFPVDTGRKMNVHPGRLLNVLCTFSLHPVSAGLAGDLNLSNFMFENLIYITNCTKILHKLRQLSH